MSKRGISPLIATVILIGFTIVLAALIMNWGGTLVENQTSQTEERIQQVTTLASLDVKIKTVIADNPENGCENLKILIKNEESTSIERFIIRITTSLETILFNTDTGLSPFTSLWFNIPVTCQGAIQKIEIFPVINVNNQLVTSDEPSDIYSSGIGENPSGPIEPPDCLDIDGDGYGLCPNCGINNGCTNNGDDCDDSNPNIWQYLIGYRDRDGDAYYSSTSEQVCSGLSLPSSYIASQGTDCNDSNPNIFPGATEICNDNIDNNCNDLTDCSDPSCSTSPYCLPTGNYYYIASSSCSDSYPGTLSQPWCTLSKAASTLQAGETVLVQNGIYPIYRINPTYSGTLNNPITFKANGNNVILDGSNQDIGFYLSNRNYITVDGFRFQNIQNPIRIWATSSTPEMKGLTFKNLYIGQGCSPGSGISIYQETNPIKDFLVDNVTFIDAGGISTWNTQNGIIRNSVFDCSNSEGAGGCYIDFRNSHDMLIENNKFFVITSHTIQIGHSSTSHGCNNVIIKNNIFYKIHDVKIDNNNNNIQVLHNTFILEKPSGGFSTINNADIYPSTSIIVKDNLFVESGWIYIPLSRIAQSNYNYWVNAWPNSDTAVIYNNLLLPNWQQANGYIHDMNSYQDRFLTRYDIFVNPDNYDFRSKTGTKACNAASDGTAIGALPCI